MFIPFKIAQPPAKKWLLAASLFAATLAVACRCNDAVAADMAMPMKSPAAPVYQWTGCYAGINGGGGAGSSNFTATVDPGTWLGRWRCLRKPAMMAPDRPTIPFWSAVARPAAIGRAEPLLPELKAITMTSTVRRHFSTIPIRLPTGGNAF